MTDLFLDPKVLNYQNDRYELILLTLRWARVLKSRGTPEPMNLLIEKALREIVEGRLTKEDILSKKVPEMPVTATEDMAAALALAGGTAVKSLDDLADDDDDKTKKSKSKKKKKDE